MDWRVVTTLIVSTLLIVVDYYHGIFPEKWIDHALLFTIIPIFLVRYVYHQPLAQFGFQWGDKKAGIIFTLAGWLLMTGIIALVAQTPDFKSYYASNQNPPLGVFASSVSDLFGWEFVFRGWLLFTLLPICGPYAILLQAIPFTIAHFGKPELETLSSIFGGTVFGYIAWRTRSFLYPFFIHWYITSITILLSRPFP